MYRTPLTPKQACCYTSFLFSLIPYLKHTLTSSRLGVATNDSPGFRAKERIVRKDKGISCNRQGGWASISGLTCLVFITSRGLSLPSRSFRPLWMMCSSHLSGAHGRRADSSELGQGSRSHANGRTAPSRRQGKKERAKKHLVTHTAAGGSIGSLLGN